MRHDNIIGVRFGRLTVIKKTERPEGVKTAVSYFLCRCDCGGVVAHTKGNLKKGSVKSCGCLRREMAGREPIHGLWNEPTYRRWQAMIGRCYSPNQQSYPHYGGRGIKVCDEWRDDPRPFHQWAMANGFAPHLQLDRIDNDGDYEPSNCRWVKPTANSRNRRSNRIVRVAGIEMTFAEASERFGVPYLKAFKRLKRGWSPEKAFEVRHAE